MDREPEETREEQSHKDLPKPRPEQQGKGYPDTRARYTEKHQEDRGLEREPEAGADIKSKTGPDSQDVVLGNG